MNYHLLNNVDRYNRVDPRNADNTWGEWNPWHRLVRYFDGTIALDTTAEATGDPLHDALEDLFVRHNRDDRPCGRLGPSLSIGDVVVFDSGEAFTVSDIGFEPVPVDDLNVIPGSWLDFVEAERRGQGAR